MSRATRAVGLSLIPTLIGTAPAWLALVVLVQTAWWIQAPVIFVRAAPPWVALALGVALAPVRALLSQSLRQRLREAALVRSARRALLRPQPSLSEADGDAAFWSAHIAEFAVSTTIPALVATLVTALFCLQFIWHVVGARSAAALVALLGAVAIAVLVSSRALANRATEALDARQHAAVWLSAALRGGVEIRGPIAHERYLSRVRAAVNAWSAKDNGFELRRDLSRVLIVAAAVAGTAVVVPGAVAIVRRALSQEVAVAVVGAALLSASYAAIRAASDSWVTVVELRRLDAILAGCRPDPLPSEALPTVPDALRAEELSLSYGDGCVFSERARTISLRGVLLISGPNGAGKSSLAGAIAGVGPAATGRLEFVCADRSVACARALREQVLFVPQEPVMVAALTVRENMALLVPEHDDASMLAALARVGLQIELDRLVSALSRGQRHRVGIARALLFAPKVLVLDEPDAWLDAGGRATLVRVLREESVHRSVIVISHRDDLRAVAATHIVIEAGQITGVSDREADQGRA
jgi:ATP-binding cassette subfamily C protein LapB